jgi:hypothetical protein
MSARTLVLWIGDHHGAVLDQAAGDVVSTVAMRLPNAARNGGAVRKARRELGLGVSFDTEAWRNQCRPDHLLRRHPFRTLGYDVRDLFGLQRLDMDTPMRDSVVSAYADAHLNGQLAYDPTIFQSPGHVIASDTGLDNEIALAEATLDTVNRRGLREPNEGDMHRRHRAVFATLCVRPEELDTEQIRKLVDRYTRLPVDGYWVWAIGFEPSGIRAEQMLRLVLALQENSGRPACPGGLKHLWQGALARGAAAAISGPDRGAVEFQPEQAPPPERKPDEDEGRQIHTYHGAILGCFGFDKRGEEARTVTFQRNLCGCGAHPSAQPPRGRKQTTAHNQWWRLYEARRVCVGSAATASRALAERLPQVADERDAVGIKSRLPVGWRRCVEPWVEAPIGWGAADGRAA